MADWLGYLSKLGFTQICMARGTVSWGSKDNDAAGELQLWYREGDNAYCLYASKAAGDDMMVSVVCKARRYKSIISILDKIDCNR